MKGGEIMQSSNLSVQDIVPTKDCELTGKNLNKKTTTKETFEVSLKEAKNDQCKSIDEKTNRDFREEVEHYNPIIYLANNIPIELNFDETIAIDKEFSSEDISLIQEIFSGEMTKLLDILEQEQVTGQISDEAITKIYSELKKENPLLEKVEIQDFKQQLVKFLELETTRESKDLKTPIQKILTAQPLEKDSNILPESLEEQDLNLEKKVIPEKVDASTQKAIEKTSTKIRQTPQKETISFRTKISRENHDDFLKTSIEPGVNIYKNPEQFSEKTVEVNLGEFREIDMEFDNIVENIVQNIDTGLKDNTETIHIRLKPDYLGEMFIKVVSEKGSLKVQLFAENAKVRQVLQMQAPELENQIQQQGYEIAKVDIHEFMSFEDMGFQNQFSGGENPFNQGKRNSFLNYRTKFVEKEESNPYERWNGEGSINYVV